MSHFIVKNKISLFNKKMALDKMIKNQLQLGDKNVGLIS